MDWLDRYYVSPDSPDDIPATTQQAVTFLSEGNGRFVEMRRQASDQAGAAPQTRTSVTTFIPTALPPAGQVARQAPFCAVLACSDARVPAEIIFDTGPNRLFVVRVAGNVLGDEVLGSIEFAARTFPETVKLVTVVGHTRCGAVAAAVASYLNPKGYAEIAFNRSLRTVVNHILVAVRSAALCLEEAFGADITGDPGYKDALAEVSVYMNAAITAYQVNQELAEHGGPPVVFGINDLATSKVGFPAGPDGFTIKLSPAPADPDQVVEYGRAVCLSDAVKAFLGARLAVPAPR